ncbi:MAG: universal stress protein [Betaproteobacteria bacterium]|nr:MAG: universal stress protein [Betaproteobacteria bacterium]
MFKRILVPIDGSSTSNRGLQQAIQMAREQKAALLLLHVVDESVLIQSAAVSGALFDDLVRSLTESGKNILAKAAALASQKGVQAKTVLIDNSYMPVADAIVKQARKLRADLIVIGTHGRRGGARLIMGSDAEGVVRQSPVPVLLIRAKGQAAGRR